MNKREFTNYIKENTKELSLEKQVDTLDRLEKYLQEYKERLTKGLLYCSACKKYFKEVDTVIKEESRVENVCTFQDAGYGDYDIYKDKKVKYTYKKCPFCNTTFQTKREIKY